MSRPAEPALPNRKGIGINRADCRDYSSHEYSPRRNDLHCPVVVRRYDPLQCSAAQRLLYYFPHEAAPLIAKRLRGLDVYGVFPTTTLEPERDRQLAAWGKREAVNGVSTDAFIKAVAWCQD